MIRVTDVSIRYAHSPAPVLDTVNLRIAPGEMTGLLGPNGSGKTTLLRAIAGSLACTAGTVFIGGDDVASLPPKTRARRMAFVPQRPESVPEFSVFTMALMGRYPHRAFLEGYTDEDAAITRRALAETAVGHLADRAARSLSGGELQRAFVARAFVQEAPVLLLDEAATGLDPAHAAAVFDRVRRRNRETGVTVLTAIHDLNMAALYCDRLVFLKDGGILADGPVRDVFTPATLERVYGAPFLVREHPAADRPQAFLLPETYRA